MKPGAGSDIPGADERRREYPDLYYYVAGVALVVALMLAGYVLFPDRDGYVTNLFTEAASVAVTLLVLNRMAEAREKRRYKQDLIYRMGSRVNDEAVRAVEELRRHGWLMDGSLKGANLVRANLEGADLEKVSLTSANLKEVELADAILDGTSLVRVMLEDANLSSARLIGAKLAFANLKRANLAVANLNGSDLWGANLRTAYAVGASFEYANLLIANLEGADIRAANFDGAVLAGATLPNGEEYHRDIDMTIFTEDESGMTWRVEVLKRDADNQPAD